MTKKKTAEAKTQENVLKAEFITDLLKPEAEKDWTPLQSKLIPPIKAKTENVHKLRGRLQDMLSEAANIQTELQGDQTVIKELTEVLWNDNDKTEDNKKTKSKPKKTKGEKK